MGETVDNTIDLIGQPIYTGYDKVLGEINVWYPYSTSRKTFGNYNAIAVANNTIRDGILQGTFCSDESSSVQRHNGCYIYCSSGNITAATYSVWGVNS